MIDFPCSRQSGSLSGVSWGLSKKIFHLASRTLIKIAMGTEKIIYIFLFNGFFLKIKFLDIHIVIKKLYYFQEPTKICRYIKNDIKI